MCEGDSIETEGRREGRSGEGKEEKNVSNEGGRAAGKKRQKEGRNEEERKANGTRGNEEGKVSA